MPASAAAPSAGNGTATAAAVPAITSFLPATVATKGSVTVQVTNLDPVAANTKVYVNGTLAAITSRTSTSVTITAPANTGSGKISLTSPGGTATSASDLYIVPTGTAVADVSGTGRITVGTKATLSVPAGKTLLRSFDGSSGDRFAVLTGAGSPTGANSSTDCTFDVRLFDVTLAQKGGNGCINATGWVDSMTTGAAGTRTLQIKNAADSVGSIDVTVISVPADVNLGTLATDGTTKTVTISSVGQNGYLPFSGTAGQRIAVQISGTSASLQCCYVTWAVYKPDGTRLGVSKSGNAFLDAVTLPTTGTYRVRVDPTTNRIGSVTVAAWVVPADANLGTLALTGVTKTVTISTPSQNGYVTFSGTAGQRVAVQLSNASASLKCCYVTWAIYKSDGSKLGTSKTGNAFLEPIALPTTDTYQVRVDPTDNRVGSVTLAAWVVAADANLGTLALDGTTKTVTFSNPGQNGYLTFAGVTGQSLTVTASNATSGLACCYVTWAVRRPSGTNLATRTGNTSVTVTLKDTGTHRIYISPIDQRVGSITYVATLN